MCSLVAKAEADAEAGQLVGWLVGKRVNPVMLRVVMEVPHVLGLRSRLCAGSRYEVRG